MARELVVLEFDAHRTDYPKTNTDSSFPKQNQVTLLPTKTTYGEHIYEILKRTAEVLDDQYLKEKANMATKCIEWKEDGLPYDPLAATAALRGPLDPLYKKGYPRSLHDLCKG